MLQRAATCPFCRKPLTALQRQLGASCGDATCRHREQLERQQQLDATVGADALRAAGARLGRAPAAVLWLRPCETRLVPMSQGRREAHRAFLQALADAADAGTAQPLPEPPPAVAPLGDQEGRLCAHCHGRCCNEGGGTHAFITLPQLLRWQRRQPGRSLDDAVAYFLERLAPRHVRQSCHYHGACGCTLPREDRAEICNSHACDALQQMRAVLREEPAAAFAVVTLENDEALRRVALTDDATARLAAGPSTA